MKRIISILVIVSVISFGILGIVYAQNSDDQKQSTQKDEQALYNFVAILFNEELRKEIADYYGVETKSIHFMYDWHSKEHEGLEVLQKEDNRYLDYSYIVRFTVKPQNNKEVLGIDTITFGVEPKLTENDFKITLVDYKHKDL